MPLDDVIGRLQDVDDVDPFVASAVVLQLDVNLRRFMKRREKSEQSSNALSYQCNVSFGATKFDRKTLDKRKWGKSQRG